MWVINYFWPGHHISVCLALGASRSSGQSDVNRAGEANSLQFFYLRVLFENWLSSKASILTLKLLPNKNGLVFTSNFQGKHVAHWWFTPALLQRSGAQKVLFATGKIHYASYKLRHWKPKKVMHHFILNEVPPIPIQNHKTKNCNVLAFCISYILFSYHN